MPWQCRRIRVCAIEDETQKRRDEATGETCQEQVVKGVVSQVEHRLDHPQTDEQHAPTDSQGKRAHDRQSLRSREGNQRYQHAHFGNPFAQASRIPNLE